MGSRPSIRPQVDQAAIDEERRKKALLEAQQRGRGQTLLQRGGSATLSADAATANQTLLGG
jgi:hypothetical protein